MVVLFTILGVLLDLLLQMFALLATGAAVASLVRGVSAAELPLILVFLVVAVAFHWILFRRIRAGRRTIETARAGSEEVGTRTPGHFITDALWIVALSAMLVAMQEPPWETAERTGATSMLLACLALCGLRVTCALRGTD